MNDVRQVSVHPRSLTRNMRIHSRKRKVIFQTIIFRFYVDLVRQEVFGFVRFWKMILSFLYTVIGDNPLVEGSGKLPKV